MAACRDVLRMSIWSVARNASPMAGLRQVGVTQPKALMKEVYSEVHVARPTPL